MFSNLNHRDEQMIPPEERDASNILKKYPDRLPVYVKLRGDLPPIDKKKYLVPKDLTVGQFLYVCRKRLKLRPEQGIFIFFNGTLASTAKQISEIYDRNKTPGGLLVATISAENTFG